MKGLHPVIVGAAGDDLTLPNRTELMTQEWLKSGKRSMIVMSDCYNQNEKGERDFARTYVPAFSETSLKAIIERTRPKMTIHGALAAFDIKLFTQFDEMIEGTVNEDQILLFRCFLMGSVIGYVEEPLVVVQTGERSRHKDIIVTLRARVKSVEQHMLDLNKIEAVDNRDELLARCNKKRVK